MEEVLLLLSKRQYLLVVAMGTLIKGIWGIDKKYNNIDT